MSNEDKIVSTEEFVPENAGQVSANGSITILKAITTTYESGRKDVRVIVPKLTFQGKAKPVASS